jgi:hypothetical protein
VETKTTDEQDIPVSPASSFKVYLEDDGAYIEEYLRNSKVVGIPEIIRGKPVTRIGSAFEKKGLTAVRIPNTVEKISGSAFSDNELSRIVLPSSLKIIGEFRNDFFIPIGAFANNRLTSVTIPEGVTTIGNSSFENNQLTSVTIPGRVTKIGFKAFAGNQLTSVTIPNSVTEIGAEAFAGNQLTSVTISRRLKRIEHGVFANNRLTSVTIPGSVTYIAMDAFEGNNLSDPLVIPGSVREILQDGFTGTISGQGAERTITITRRGGYGEKYKIYRIPDAMGGIPVTRIAEKVFYIENDYHEPVEMTVDELVLPAGLVEIGADAFLGVTVSKVTAPNAAVKALWDDFYAVQQEGNKILHQQIENKRLEKEMETIRSFQNVLDAVGGRRR